MRKLIKEYMLRALKNTRPVDMFNVSRIMTAGFCDDEVINEAIDLSKAIMRGTVKEAYVVQMLPVLLDYIKEQRGDYRTRTGGIAGRGREVRNMAWPEPEKDFRYGKWKKVAENGIGMLRCPYCESQVIREDYEYAIGTNGIRFCPYCGEDMWSKGDDEYEGNL